MVEIIPYILVLLSWHVDDPEGTIQVKHKLFAGAEECELQGNEYVEQRRIYREEFGKMRFSYSCIEAPKVGDWRRLNEQQE